MGMPESDSYGTALSGEPSTNGPYVSFSQRSLPSAMVIFPRWLYVRRRAREQVSGDDELLDLRGALVDLGDLRVPEVPLDLVLLDEAVAAVDLHGVRRDAHGHLGGEELGHRRLGPEGLAPVLEERRAQREQARRLDRRRHVGQHPLDHLVLADRHAEALALARVAERGLVRRDGDADGLRGDADAAAVDGRHGDLEPLPLLAEPAGRRHAAALEEQLGGVGGADAELVLRLDD